MTFKERLEKARQIYEERGEISREEVCILLNCEYTQDIIKKKCKELGISLEVEMEAIKILKKYEKCYGIGNVELGEALALMCIYVAGLRVRGYKERYRFRDLGKQYKQINARKRFKKLLNAMGIPFDSRKYLHLKLLGGDITLKDMKYEYEKRVKWLMGGSTMEDLEKIKKLLERTHEK